MPQVSSMDATYHAAQDLIYALQNTAPKSPLVKLGNGKNEALRTLAEISRKATPPAVPLRVTVREAGQKKLQTKSAPQSKPFTNAYHLRLPIVEAYPYELQPGNPAKNPIFSANQKPGFNSYTTNGKIAKNEIWKNKSGYNSNTSPFDPQG